MDLCELAWAAGFFDGEGWAAAARQGRGDRRRPQARVNQADPLAVPAALIRFQAALDGLGRIGGPHRKERRVDLYRWEVSSRGDVERLQELLAPWLGQVKLSQFGEALGRPALRSVSPKRSNEWRAWAAGLYDGEGSLCLLAHRTHEGYRIPEMSVTQLAERGTPEVLTRFLQIAGRGRVYGPYVQEGAHAAVYRWRSGARGDIEEVFKMLEPRLGPVKRKQAADVFGVIRAQPALPRGRKEWGSHKSHCIRGHEYSKTRLRPFVPRGAGLQRRDSHQCLQCAREQARARREQKERPAIHDDRRSLSERAKRYLLKYALFISMKFFHLSGTASSGKIALTGHTDSHAPQSMHSSGWMKYMLSASVV